MYALSTVSYNAIYHLVTHPLAKVSHSNSLFKSFTLSQISDYLQKPETNVKIIQSE